MPVYGAWRRRFFGIDHRSTDLLARYGGEEFAFLFPAADVEDAARIGEIIRLRIQRMREEPENAGDHPVSISIGCAL